MARWRDIADALRREIEGGTYPPGSRLPTEGDLTRQHGVGRKTIRQALAQLNAEGLLTARPRAGTFVRRPPVKLAVSRYASAADPDRAHSDLGPWEAACAAQGIDGRAEVVSVAGEPAPEPVASRLDIAPGAEVIHRVRHMWAGDRLAQVQDAYVPAAIAAGTPLAGDAKVVGGTYAAMTRAGFPPAEVTEEVAARMPTGDVAALLDLAPGVPVLELWRTTYDRRRRPVEVVRVVAAADQTALTYDRLPIEPRE